ncbi:MAG: PilZ domain-containing protein [Desulfobacterales bacterium]|nr:PilZ domain-containing protein [Desulfobacterales bacterium]
MSRGIKKINTINQRKETRRSIESIVLPFLGTREIDHEPFQFLIMDISATGIKIAIPKWLVGRDRLKNDDIINLHIPFRLDKATYNQGKVVWKRSDDTISGELYGIHMENRVFFYDPISILLKTSEIDIDFQDFDSLEGLFIKIIKDISLLKKGVFIYLNHLVPYFSRISSYSNKEEYSALKKIFLDDIISKVKNNYENLYSLYKKAKEKHSLIEEIPQNIDLEELREMVESEINIDVLKTAFESDAVIPYLNAIKQLEKKQYDNYNTVVMLYIKALKV